MIGTPERHDVEESLRCWCRQSLESADKHWSDSIEERTFLTAEYVVDAAAFHRILDERRYSGFVKHFHGFPPGLIAEEAFQSLVTSCPLNASNAPEVLGSIHEYLVSLRGSNLKRASDAGSKSRKANGIFYTPTYIVDEIVHRTIGPRLRTAGLSDGKYVRILDPAAGSGAFLVAAYRYLIQSEIQALTSKTEQGSSRDAVQTKVGPKLSLRRCFEILNTQLFGVDLDSAAIEVTRRILWLTMIDSADKEFLPEPIDISLDQLATNFKHGHALTGHAFGGQAKVAGTFHVPSVKRFDWEHEFPQVAMEGGFDVVIGNPPYRRERDFKHELDEILATDLGKAHRSARMDLWYYFFYRGIQLLRTGGSLSFITNAYWMQGRGAVNVIDALREDVHLDELFLLRNQPIFPGVTGQHVIFRVTKLNHDGETIIKLVPRELASSARPFLTGEVKVQTFTKTKHQLFCDGRLNVMPSGDELLQKLKSWPRLIEFGIVRQGIAENPAAINLRTLDRLREDALIQGWTLGEGVFSLLADEVSRLALQTHEAALLRPYHDLCDLDRYWAAERPSRQLIYSTRRTCPEIADFPGLQTHLTRFRAILDARRETRQGSNRWWHLHWPRDDRIWRADKLVAIQMAIRPSFVPIFGPSYVPFSANVFVPNAETEEDLRYFSALLNSKVLWAWFTHYAKRRGVGLELNGHVLERAPIYRIDFDNPEAVRKHDDLVRDVERRVQLSSLKRNESQDLSDIQGIEKSILEVESRIDSTVASIYGLTETDLELVNEITHDEAG